MSRNNHVQLAQEIVDAWPEWKKQAIRNAVDAHKPVEKPEEAEIILLFPSASSDIKK